MTNKSLDEYFTPKNVRHMRNYQFLCFSICRTLFQKHVICFFIELLKRDLEARVGGEGEGHSSNANRLLNNSAKYSDNFLTVNLPIFKSLYTRLFSPPKISKNVRPHCSNSIKECIPIIVNPAVKMGLRSTYPTLNPLTGMYGDLSSTVSAQ